MRYTRKDAEAAFERLARAVGPDQDAEHEWILDHNATYGGFVVAERRKDLTGGEDRPLGDMRRTAREFCEAVSFALRVVEAAERNGRGT